jgi:hypothetical protein
MDVSVSGGEKLLAAYKDPAYKERHFAALRKAGLK